MKRSVTAVSAIPEFRFQPLRKRARKGHPGFDSPGVHGVFDYVFCEIINVCLIKTTAPVREDRGRFQTNHNGRTRQAAGVPRPNRGIPEELPRMGGDTPHGAASPLLRGPQGHKGHPDRASPPGGGIRRGHMTQPRQTPDNESQSTSAPA